MISRHVFPPLAIVNLSFIKQIFDKQLYFTQEAGAGYEMGRERRNGFCSGWSSVLMRKVDFLSEIMAHPGYEGVEGGSLADFTFRQQLQKWSEII